MEEEEKQKKSRRGRPRKQENWTAELLAERARGYFAKCDRRTREEVTKGGVEVVSNPEPYSIEGLCVYLDITRKVFDAWRKRGDELGERAEKIHLRITANRITGALDGTQNCSFAQFMLKNNCPEQYREKVEVENSISDKAASMFEQWSSLWKRSEAGTGV